VSAHGAVTLRPPTADRRIARHRRPDRLVLLRSLVRAAMRHTPVLAVALVGLGAVLHFLPGRPVLTVDGFFHLSNTYNCGQDTHPWTSLTSVGQPNTALVLMPVDCSIALLQLTHLPLWTTEALFEALLAMSGAAGMYLCARQVGQILRVRSRVGAIVAGLFWVANPFALAYIWYHVMYVEVLWATLPWLCLFVLAAEGERRIGKLCLGAFAVSVVASPGLTEGELPQTLVTLGFMCLFVGVTCGRRALLRSVAVVGAWGSALLWWLLPSLANLGNLYSAAVKITPTKPILDFSSYYSSTWHLLTLSAVPQLYQTVNGVPYIAWSALATSHAGRIILAAIPLLGVVGIMHLGVRRSGWIRLSPLLGMFGTGLAICKGEAQPLPATGMLLTRLPMGSIFRQPLNNFGVFIVLPLSFFVGFGLFAVYRIAVASADSSRWRMAKVSACVVSCGSLALVLAPWWSDHVFPAGGGNFPSAQYVLPLEYQKVGALLAKSPAGGKTLELPFSSDGESAFVWPSGAQPNSDPLFQAWQGQRSVLESDGQSTTGPGLKVAQCISAGLPDCLSLAEQLGIDRIVVHKDWNDAYFGARTGIPVVSSDTALSYLLDSRTVSSRPVARSRDRSVAVGASGSVSMWVSVSSLPKVQDRFLSFDGYFVQLNHENFFSVYSPSHRVWAPGAVLPRSKDAVYLTLTWSAGKLQLWVNGVPESRAVPFRGSPPKDVEVLTPGSAPGTTRATSGVIRLAVPPSSCGVIPCTLRGGARVLDWGKNLAVVSLPHAKPLLSSGACGTASTSAAHPALIQGGTFVIGQGGCNRVDFLETYDQSWTLAPMSPGAQVTGHGVANDFYNQWTVTGPATAVYALRYTGASTFHKAFIAGTLLGIAYVAGIFAAEAAHRRRRSLRTAGSLGDQSSGLPTIRSRW
jgi:hypothetical protein